MNDIAAAQRTPTPAPRPSIYETDSYHDISTDGKRENPALVDTHQDVCH